MEKERNSSWSKVTTSSVRHGGVSVITWTCMAANGTGSLVFTDDVTADRSSSHTWILKCIGPYYLPDSAELIEWSFTDGWWPKTYRSDETPQGRNLRIWGCPWVPDSRQSLTAKFLMLVYPITLWSHLDEYISNSLRWFKEAKLWKLCPFPNIYGLNCLHKLYYLHTTEKKSW